MSGDRRGGPGTPGEGGRSAARARPPADGAALGPDGAAHPPRRAARANGAASAPAEPPAPIEPPAPPPEPAPSPEPPDEAAEGGLMSRLLRAFAPSSDDAAPSGPATPPGMPGIANLRRMRVEEVGVPRAEIDAVPLDIPLDDLVTLFRETQYTRLPVFDGTLDVPVGLIHFKDLALRHGFGGGDAFDLRAELRPLLFAPPSMPIGVLLQKMQADRIHMALVIDEYGGVDGLVTLEDLIEQVIGEIEDEHDEAEGDLWKLEKPGQYIVQARAPLDEFETEIGAKLCEPDEEIDTLGGLVFMLLGRIPVRGEVVPMENGVEFEVMDADPRRIKRLRVRLPAGLTHASDPRE